MTIDRFIELLSTNETFNLLCDETQAVVSTNISKNISTVHVRQGGDSPAVLFRDPCDFKTVIDYWIGADTINSLEEGTKAFYSAINYCCYALFAFIIFARIGECMVRAIRFDLPKSGSGRFSEGGRLLMDYFYGFPWKSGLYQEATVLGRWHIWVRSHATWASKHFTLFAFARPYKFLARDAGLQSPSFDLSSLLRLPVDFTKNDQGSAMTVLLRDFTKDEFLSSVSTLIENAF